MDSKAVFTQESHKEAFMGLCINVLPLIGEIIDSAKKSGVDGMVGLTVDTNGYISFDVHNSRWGMKRLDSDSPAKIEYRFIQKCCAGQGSRNMQKRAGLQSVMTPAR